MSFLRIPNTLKTNKEGYEFLSGMMTSILQNCSDQRVVVDFSNCVDIDGNLAAVIGAVLDKIKGRFPQILIIIPRNKTVRKILARNHFLRSWDVKIDFEERENYVEYSKFGRDVPSDAFKEYINNDLVCKQKFPKHTKLAGEKIVESIFEIYVNAVTHGKSESVHSCGEYIVDKHVLEMTIVDCGQSIPGNVNEYLKQNKKPKMDDCEAIQWAFVSGNTTKEQTGGLGLAIIKEFIELNEGSIQVVSGRGFVEYKGRAVERFLLTSSFPGTVVNMKFNFDDDKKYFFKGERQQINEKDLL